jgi:hypothetical protein
MLGLAKMSGTWDLGPRVNMPLLLTSLANIATRSLQPKWTLHITILVQVCNHKHWHVNQAWSPFNKELESS